VIVDAHVHVFRPAAVVPRPVDGLTPADRDAPVTDLVARMDAAGIDRAVLVPLAGGDAEAEYVAGAAAAYPGRFARVAVGTPRPGVRALRAAPDPGTVRGLAASGGILWSYPSPPQFAALEAALEAHPDLTVVLNHLGFTPHDMRVDALGRPCFADPFPGDLPERIAALARYPRTHLMFSGQYALSRQEAPYEDLTPVARRLGDAFGADRMLWASDHPWTRDRPGAAGLLELPRLTFPGASSAELAAILGGTALRLFPELAGPPPPTSPTQED
jgi:L-fuconolactonase